MRIQRKDITKIFFFWEFLFRVKNIQINYFGQNSVVSKEFINNNGGKVVHISTRSTYLNVTKKAFSLTEKPLDKNTKKKVLPKKLFQNSWLDQSQNVENIIASYNKNVIEKLSRNMMQRFEEVIRAKGQRIKFLFS